MIQEGLGERTYRSFEPHGARRVPFRVRVSTTDLYLRADRDLSADALSAARRARRAVEDHIARFPGFETALSPLDPPPNEELPQIVTSMYAAGRAAGVGPMAAVAGAIAGCVGRELRASSSEVLVENGGDIYLDLQHEAFVGLFAGRSAFTGRLGFRVDPKRTPLSVCTSSGTVGPSLSFGRADAAVVFGPDPALADAVATALGNRIRETADLEPAVRWALGVPGVLGAVGVLGVTLAARGEVEFIGMG